MPLRICQLEQPIARQVRNFMIVRLNIFVFSVPPISCKTMMEREPTKYADLVASDLPVEGPIEEDIPRTMYDHELFCRKSRVNGRDMLRRVLTAYGRYDREVVGGRYR